MKKQILVGILLITITFISCKESTSENYHSDVNNFVSYVDSVDRMNPVYTESQWTTIDNGYNTRLSKIEAYKENDADQKAKVEETRTKYKLIHERYELNIQKARASADMENKANKARSDLRNQLFGEGKYTGNWNFVTTGNVVSVYENFVDKVRRNGDNYTDEDWVEVRSLWKGLNERKEEIDNDMSVKDNTKVAGLRIAFAAVKSVSRPLSKAKEEVRKDKN
ncbi:MAG: DUF6565 domain-containing protein [Ferruginibacter sp.]